MSHELLDKIVITKTAQGLVQGAGKVIGFANHPVYIIKGPDGENFTWAAHLCHEVDAACPDCEGRGFVLRQPRGDFLEDLVPEICRRCAKGEVK